MQTNAFHSSCIDLSLFHSDRHTMLQSPIGLQTWYCHFQLSESVSKGCPIHRNHTFEYNINIFIMLFVFYLQGPIGFEGKKGDVVCYEIFFNLNRCFVIFGYMHGWIEYISQSIEIAFIYWRLPDVFGWIAGSYSADVTRHHCAIWMYLENWSISHMSKEDSVPGEGALVFQLVYHPRPWKRGKRVFFRH